MREPWGTPTEAHVLAVGTGKLLSERKGRWRSVIREQPGRMVHESQFPDRHRQKLSIQNFHL